MKRKKIIIKEKKKWLTMNLKGRLNVIEWYCWLHWRLNIEGQSKCDEEWRMTTFLASSKAILRKQQKPCSTLLFSLVWGFKYENKMALHINFCGIKETLLGSEGGWGGISFLEGVCKKCGGSYFLFFFFLWGELHLHWFI